MINKPPALSTKKPEQWISEYLVYFESLRNELSRVKGQWFPAQSNDIHGKHPGEQVTAGNSAFISVVIPLETNEIREVVLRFIPTTTGTIDYTISATYGGLNEDESANTATLTADGLAVTDDQIMEIDVTSLFSAVEGDNQVGVEFVLDAVSTTANVFVLGLYFKFK